MQQLCSRFLPHAIAGEQSLGISQHCGSAAAQVAVITGIRLFCLLKKKRKEKTTPFGANLMRSQVLYRAA